MSTLSIEYDDSESSDLMSYYCLDCDTRNELGFDTPPFVCGTVYSSDEESISKRNDNILLSAARPAQRQVFVTFGSETGTKTPDADNIMCDRSYQWKDGRASNNNTTILVSQVEWDTSQRRVRLVREKSELNRRRLVANLS
jgi:hypothetical protein